MDKDRFIGRLLDNRYEILEPIGTGGMAIVYKARDHRLNRLVAIKLLRDDNRQDEEFRRRFHAESQAVAMLSHPNIVSVYDVSVTTEADFIVMELIDGISLKQYMAKKGMLNWKETLHFAMQIAKALEHAHSKGLVHRDIKPHNVMVLKNGSVKVTDFGIARIMSKSNTLTKEALGSVHYISPEQAKGGRVDNRSDLYSLGVVMYEMMTGQPPFDGDSPVSVAIQHISGGAAMPSTINPNIPGGLEQIIMKAMSLDPAQRYASATEMLYDMDELRKNPLVLFDYNLGGRAYVPPAYQPITDTARIRTGNPPRKREEPPVEEKPKNNMTMAAIIACAAVAVVALAILLVLFFSDGLGGSREELVRVPNLVGKIYKELPEYDGITLKLYDYENSDEYAEGKVTGQRPEADSQVVEGTIVYLTVSKGPEETTEPAETDTTEETEPEESRQKDMPRLSDLTKENAVEILEDLGLELKIKYEEEASETVKAGNVIKTRPSDEGTLSKGDTVILWISTGPKTVEMPNVVGKSLAEAKKLLENAGISLNNVTTEEVDSAFEKDTVVQQSVERGSKVKPDTQIKLSISKGVPETTAPKEVEVVKVVELKLPAREEAYSLTVKFNGEEVTDPMIVEPGVTNVPMQLTGKGVQYYELYIDGEYYSTQKVDFTPNG